MADNPAETSPLPSTAHAPRKSIARSEWVLFGLVFIVFLETAETMVSGHPIDTATIASDLVLSGVTMATYRKHRGRSGWRGFFEGLVIGLAGIFVLSGVCGFLRGIFK